MPVLKHFFAIRQNKKQPPLRKLSSVSFKSSVFKKTAPIDQDGLQHLDLGHRTDLQLRKDPQGM